MPPSKSGIADYSEALVSELSKRADVGIFSSPEKRFEPSSYDAILYQIGNNPHHDFVYETALRHPGFVVMHEANLHHLVAHLTIRRDDWDGYVAECDYDGGPAALEFAHRVRRLEVGPDYEGVPMTRRLLTASKAVIVHSNFVARLTREQGFTGPVATIPHGAWLPEETPGLGPGVNRLATRHELGLDESTPLIGAFGHLKPYKRIAESLRAFRRVSKLEPRARMILVGEPHPEFRVDQTIRSLGLSEQVRVIGFAPIEKFVRYMGACDIVLNLRYPTVGETSGSLQRAMGLGKAVIVSDVGAFSELPDDICLKVAPGCGEEDLIFEYLNLLVSRPDLAKAMGGRARDWVARECDWGVVAERYLDFLRDPFAKAAAEAAQRAAQSQATQTFFVSEPTEAGTATAPPASASEPTDPESASALLPAVEALAAAPADPEHASAAAPTPSDSAVIQPGDITAWLAPEGRAYAATHRSRLIHTLEITPPGDASRSVLEMGAYMQITAALKFQLGYGSVRGCYFGPLGRIDHKTIRSETGEVFECDLDHFDAEKDVYPYADASFDTVLCCELIEHLFADPMHMMNEINRILKTGGHLVLTTPNIGSLRSVSAILLGYHPAFFPAYIRPRAGDDEVEARHNREYVPMEIQHLLTNSGFDVVLLETGEFLDEPHPEFGWVTHLLKRYKLSHDLRGDGIYAVARKSGAVKDRWPAWLYS
jgi:glycosyltransferase involved in cell wall biosynthesis/SAM-dependent methyltransferase